MSRRKWRRRRKDSALLVEAGRTKKNIRLDSFLSEGGEEARAQHHWWKRDFSSSSFSFSRTVAEPLQSLTFLPHDVNDYVAVWLLSPLLVTSCENAASFSSPIFLPFLLSFFISHACLLLSFWFCRVSSIHNRSFLAFWILYCSDAKNALFFLMQGSLPLLLSLPSALLVLSLRVFVCLSESDFTIDFVWLHSSPSLFRVGQRIWYLSWWYVLWLWIVTRHVSVPESSLYMMMMMSFCRSLRCNWFSSCVSSSLLFALHLQNDRLTVCVEEGSQ